MEYFHYCSLHVLSYQSYEIIIVRVETSGMILFVLSMRLVIFATFS